MARSPRAVADECIFHVFELAEDAIQDRGDLPAGHVIDALRDETAVELDDLIRGAVLLVQPSDAECRAELMIAARGQDTAEGDIDMRFDRSPFRGKNIEERTSRLQNAVNLRIGQFLIGHMLEDLGREYKIERVVRPRDLGHGRIFGPVAGCRVETEALAVGGQSQLDVVLHVITGHMRKSSVEEFVSVTAIAITPRGRETLRSSNQVATKDR